MQNDNYKKEYMKSTGFSLGDKALIAKHAALSKQLLNKYLKLQIINPDYKKVKRISKACLRLGYDILPRNFLESDKYPHKLLK